MDPNAFSQFTWVNKPFKAILSPGRAFLPGSILFFQMVLMGLVLFWIPSKSSAQQLTSGADFLTIDSGARSEGMGGAFTAMADDVTALTWNPAGMALLTRPQVSYLHMLYLSDIGYNFGGVVIPFKMGEDTLGLGAGMINLGTGLFDSTLGLAPAVSAGDNAFLLSAAYRMKTLISFGVTAKYIQRSLASYSANAFAGDAGVLFTPVDRIRIGLGVFNFGEQVQFISASDPLPLSGRLGLAWRLLEIPHNSLTLSADNGWQFGSQTYTGAVGGEYWYDRTLALRAGFTGDSYQQHPTAGCGINVDPVEFDYAFSPQGTLGATHRFSLLLNFGSEVVEGLVAPLDFKALPFDGALSLHWKPVSSNLVVGYNLYVKNLNSNTMLLVTKRPLGAQEASVRLNHLVNGQNYTFGISSLSAAGRESSMSTLSASPGAPSSVSFVQAPTGFRADPQAEGLKLSWDKPLSSNVKGYFLYFADEQGNPGKKLSSEPINDHVVLLKKVNPNQTYSFFLTAVNYSGYESEAVSLSANLSNLSKTQTAAAGNPTPTHLTLQVKEDRVRLNWDNAGDGIKYNVYLSLDGTNFKLLTPAGIFQTHTMMGPIKSGITYYFGVTTLNQNGTESTKAVQALTVANPSP